MSVLVPVLALSDNFQQCEIITVCLICTVSMFRSRAIFNSPSLEDLGIFSCVVTNTEGVSSSYTLTEEGESGPQLKRDSLVIPSR